MSQVGLEIISPVQNNMQAVITSMNLVMKVAVTMTGPSGYWQVNYEASIKPARIVHICD